MGDTIEHYLREVGAGLRVDDARKRPILDELRAHLYEKVHDLARADPSRDRDELERQVVADFGDARDLALGYTPEPALVRRTTGEVVLEVGRAVGRGTEKALRATGRGLGVFVKWLAIALAVMLVLTVGVGVWAFYEIKPLVEKNAPVPVFERHDACSAACNHSVDALTFYVHPEAREVRFDLDVSHAKNSTGVVVVRVQDPNGTLVFDEAFPANGTSHASVHQTWGPQAGDWRVSLEYVSFRGYVDAEAWTVGLPAHALDDER